MKKRVAAILTALAAWLVLNACGCPAGSYDGVTVPSPPGARVRVELFYKPIHPIMAEYAQFVRVTGADSVARDYPMRLNSGGQFKVNVYLLPPDVAGGPYFRFEEAYGHYLLNLVSGSWYLVGPPLEMTRFGPQPRQEIMYYHGTAIPREVSLTEAQGDSAGAGANYAENSDEEKMFSGAVTARDGMRIYGGSYYGCATVGGFTPAAAAPEARDELFIASFSPLALVMQELPLPCPGADSVVFYRYTRHGLNNCGLRITGADCDLMVALPVDRDDYRANLFAYPAAGGRGPLLRLITSEAELLIEPRRQRIRELARARGRVYIGERMDRSMGTREIDGAALEVTIGDRPAPPAPAEVAAGPGTYLGRIDVSGDTPVFFPAATAPELPIPRPQMHLHTLDWAYDTGLSAVGQAAEQKRPKTR